MTRQAFGPSMGRPGPVHRSRADGDDLSWCGVKVGFRHEPRPVEQVDCPRCIRQVRKGQPLARGAR